MEMRGAFPLVSPIDQVWGQGGQRAWLPTACVPRCLLHSVLSSQGGLPGAGQPGLAAKGGLYRGHARRRSSPGAGGGVAERPVAGTTSPCCIGGAAVKPPRGCQASAKEDLTGGEQQAPK